MQMELSIKEWDLVSASQDRELRLYLTKFCLQFLPVHQPEMLVLFQLQKCEWKHNLPYATKYLTLAGKILI